MKKIAVLVALLAVVSIWAQEYKYGITANFHKGSIARVHDVSKGAYGGGLGFFGEVPIVENDIFDSAYLFLGGLAEYSTQGEVAEAEVEKLGKQKFMADYANAAVYIKWFFHRGNMRRDAFLFGGPKVEFLVRNKKEVSPVYEAAYYKYNLDNNMNKFGYGVIVGAGVKVASRVDITLRFDRGFAKVYKDNPESTYNRLLSLGINYYLNPTW